MSDEFMKAPCKHCPFRNDVTPFLHPERADEIATSTNNPYSDFPCHKTLEYDDEGEDLQETERSKTCAGFLTMQISEGVVECPEGFKPAENIYSDPYEMAEAYEWEWNKKQRKRRRA
jgi:hypothetical protein